MIKCVLTELGRVGREDIWFPGRMHEPRYATVGPYVQTSSQIFSCPSLPLSQYVHITQGETQTWKILHLESHDYQIFMKVLTYVRI